MSDFIDEHNGFLALSDEEHDRAKALNPRIHKYDREFLEYGESREGYWTRDKFVAQMHRAIEIAEIKYPKEEADAPSNRDCRNKIPKGGGMVSRVGI